MRGYFLGLLAFAICCAAVELLTPSGEGGGVAGHMKWMSGICLLCVLLVPIVQAGSAGGDLLGRLEAALDDWLDLGEEIREEYDDLWQEEYEQMDLTCAEESISLLLQQRFEILAGDLSVRVQADEAGERIATVHIGLGGRAVWLDTHKIEAYIEQTLGCECITYMK